MKTLGNRGGSKWISPARDEEDTNRTRVEFPKAETGL